MRNLARGFARKGPVLANSAGVRFHAQHYTNRSQHQPYVTLLKKDATLAIVGCLTPFALPTDNSEVAFHRRNLAGSLIGGIVETQEVLDFCGKHNIVSEVDSLA